MVSYLPWWKALTQLGTRIPRESLGLNRKMSLREKKKN